MRKKKIVNGVVRKVAGSTGNRCCTNCRFTSKGNYSCPCPHCHERMLCMGIRFRMPRKQNDNAWRKLKEIEEQKNAVNLIEDMRKARDARRKNQELHFT